MTPATYHSSRPDRWAAPAARTDPGERRRIYGPIRPMAHEHGFFDWLLGRKNH